MAEIFLARPAGVSRSKLVAVKRILPEHSGNDEFTQMFLTEGEIALRMRHPAIIMALELGTVSNQHYMSMEYFPGKTLAQFMIELRKRKQTLNLPEKLYIVKQITEALQYMHEFSDYGESIEIIHRDISPQNIMIGFKGGVKLIDFGIAKMIDKLDQTKSSVFKGKVAYMSPEQVRGESLTQQTDIFSLGVVLWEILTNHKLFSGSTIQEITKKVEACKIPPVSEHVPYISPEVQRICSKALAASTLDRYQNAADFLYDLNGVLREFNFSEPQKRISAVLGELFPEDTARLQELLKKYEGEALSIPVAAPAIDDATVLIQTKIPDQPKFDPGPSPFEKSRARRSTKTHLKKREKWPQQLLTVGVLGLLISAAWIGGKSLRTAVNEHVPAESVVESPPSPVQSPVIKEAPPHRVPTATVTPEPPAPPPVVHPQPLPPPPAPEPQVEIRPRIVPPPPIQEEAPKRVVLKKPVPKKVIKKPAPPKAAPATAAVEKTASLTIFAEPNAKIYVDGKLVGIEIVNDLRVAADKTVTVRVLPKSGKGAIVRNLQLKPYSQNVVDISLPTTGTSE